MDLQHRIAIHATRSEIWPLLTELDQVKRWNASIIRSEAVSSGPVEVGFRSKLWLQEGNREVEYDEEITAFEVPNAVEIRMSGGSLGKKPMVVRYDLVEQEGSTLLRQRCTWQPSGLILRLMAGMISKSSAKTLEENLRKIKEIAETQKGGA
jgi:carbon monoxide dehydrogenase subunit G